MKKSLDKSPANDDDSIWERRANRWTAISVPIFLLLAVLACFLALPSFLNALPSREPLSPPNVNCSFGLLQSVQGPSGETAENAVCDFFVEDGETIVGTAIVWGFEDNNTSHECVAFVFLGPLNLEGVRVNGLRWNTVENITSDETASLIEAETEAVIRQAGPCFQKNVYVIVLPAQINIQAYNEIGTEYMIPLAGSYEIKIVKGAYSSFPAVNLESGLWRTKIFVYKNSDVIWGERPKTFEDNPNLIYVEPVNPFGELGYFEVASYDEAEYLGQISSSINLALKVNDQLTFIVIDDKGWYEYPSPNVGVLTIELRLK
ncbi:MAG: hypothetical protein IT314_09900 [Anaerolineales bacterium]|nr:hypothetical protein [Anaerolineales bacterium]